ncbi:hypothetical protein PAXINDRAFT_13973 [Paxillus involutus ATCC 200175]|uniref:Protein kinase domain-containing protein n=1 Tax=Paxillus involutus ATCC 200175 TaxID=664439 RepID=A0A0C9TSA3_PAXIN|nr:hypothetical protein PAXINDRAFT_13973 [Paxillus involutus ATCC 200175]
MDYNRLVQTWWESQRQSADLSSISWLLNTPPNDTAPPSDTFQNVATGVPTSTGPYQTLLPPHSHDSQSTYEGIFPETNLSAKASSGTTFLDHPPHNFVRQHADDSESSGDRSSSLRTGPEVRYPIRIQGGDPASHARLEASVRLRGPYTPEDMPNPGETVLCDDLNFVTLHPDGLGSNHVYRVSFVYWVLQRSLEWHGCESCPKARELWLQMIEGKDDVDEIWLWVDGDEEWIRQDHDANVLWVCSELEKEDWVAAQSALRRRIEREQLSPRPVPKNTAGLTLEDHARLRKATPAQRFAALYWLICTSRRKEELDLQHGLSSRSNFALHDVVGPWFSAFGSVASFPEQPEAWNDFLEKRNAMGCDCFHSKEKTRDWARMMKWLQPEWNLDTDIGCLSYCNSCKSSRGHKESKPERPAGGRSTLLATLHSWRKGYPKVMQDILVSHSGEVGPYSQLHSLPPAEALRDEYLDELPVRFGDDAPNLITLVGTVIWISACRFLDRAEVWHWVWADFMKFIDILPLPELEGTQLELRNHLKTLWLEDRSSCFRCVDYLHEEDEDDKDYFWTSYAAIIIYVKSLNLGPKFEGYPKCHAVYLTVVTRSRSGAETSLAQDRHDRQLPDRTAPSTPRDLVSSPLHRRSLSPAQVDNSNDAYLSPSLFDVPLPLDDRQLRFNARLREPTIFLPPAVLPERLLTLPASSCLNIVEIGAKDERHTPAQIKQPGDTVNFTEGVIPGRQIPANMTQEGNLVASRLHSSPDPDVIADGPSGVPSPVPFQPSSIRSIITPSVTQKHFGDIPDLIEYLQRLHIDPVATGGYGNVYKCSLRHANDHSSEVAVKSFRHELTQDSSSLPEQEFSGWLARVHGDLTSGNVLIDNDGKARLSDFGLSAVLGGLNGGSSFALTTCRPGAIEWAAPELVLTPDSVQPCPVSDIFSVGCIMLQILSGQPPWGKMNRNKIILSLDKGERAPRPAHRPIRDRDWDFIRRCWSSADVRPSIEDVVDYISPVLASLREDHGLAAGASLQSYERPATRKRTYLEVVLENDSASRRGASRTSHIASSSRTTTSPRILSPFYITEHSPFASSVVDIQSQNTFYVQYDDWMASIASSLPNLQVLDLGTETGCDLSQVVLKVTMRGAVSLIDGLPRLHALGLVFDGTLESLPAAHEYWGVWNRNLTVIRVGTSPIDVPVEVVSRLSSLFPSLKQVACSPWTAKEGGLDAAIAGEHCVSFTGECPDSVEMFVEGSLVASFSAVLA